MSGSHDNSETKPVSVAELLARNGTIGAPPVGGRRRRKRGNSSALSVAELTGEIPLIGDLTPPPPPDVPTWTDEAVADEAPAVDDEPVVDEEPVDEEPVVDDEPVVREEPVLDEAEPEDRPDGLAAIDFDVRAEEMAPDPVDEDLPDAAVAVAEERDAAGTRDVAAADQRPGHIRAVTQPRNHVVFTEDDVEVEEALKPEAETPREAPAEHTISEELDELEAEGARPTRMRQLLRAGLVVLQSVLAAALGAALFLAFDELWKWNNIVALVLSQLVILGLVAAVRIIRKTEDTASTLIAVAVGALVTMGPLALMQTH